MYSAQGGKPANAFSAALASAVGVVEVWPDAWKTFRLFTDVGTQWRSGMAGATGLDYTPLFRLLDEEASDRAEWRELFDEIRLMEREALECMRKAQG